MTEQWQELKETIKELRYSNGDLTQQEVCSFLGVYMETLEKQMQESTYAKGTIIKSALKYLVKRQIEEGSVGFAVDNDHDHDCCWDDVLTWIETQSCENAVSRDVLTEYINTKLTSNEEWASDATNEGRWVEEKTYLYGVEILEDLDEYVKTMPPVTPTSEDIKEAYLKGYNYGVKDWFRSKTQPYEDCISREEAINEADNLSLETSYDNEKVEQMLRDLPPVKPKYTDEEIDKAQAVEQAYVDKRQEGSGMKKKSNIKYTFVVIVCCQGNPTEYEYSNLFSALIGYAKQYLQKKKYGTMNFSLKQKFK